MMAGMYKVVHSFADVQDSNYVYLPGSSYPRDGFFPTEERIAELLSDKNKRGVPLIEEIKAPKREVPKKEEPIETPKVEEEPKPRKERRKKG